MTVPGESSANRKLAGNGLLGTLGSAFGRENQGRSPRTGLGARDDTICRSRGSDSYGKRAHSRRCIPLDSFD